MEIVNAILCRLCLSMVATGLCKCHNMGVLIDDDEHIHLYVEDITTTQRGLLYLHNDKEVRRELFKPFKEAIYADYSVVNQPFTLKPIYVPKQRVTNYNTSLVKALNKNKYKTSDGNQKFRRVATHKGS